MIKLFNNVTSQYHTFEITKFPDGTSQVWKITPEPSRTDCFTVTWMFEDEAEYVHVLQMGALLADNTTAPELYAPFLPYGRQDKPVSNRLSFAGVPLMWALRELYSEILTHQVSFQKDRKRDSRVVDYGDGTRLTLSTAPSGK
jgi:hypothetical protein